MARTKLTPEEAEKRKFARRAAKKAKRKLEKAGVEVVETTAKKGKTSKEAFKLIEVATSDSASNKRIGELKEAGIPIKQIAFAADHIIYEVPSNVTGFSNYSTIVTKEKAPKEKPLTTVAELTKKVEEDKADNVKMNKRYIKLLVRNSALKRNEKAEAVTALLKKFKIK